MCVSVFVDSDWTLFLFDSVNPSLQSLFKAAVEGVMSSIKTDALLISDRLVKEEHVGITEETVSV